jgi:SAM-dependent methyltransferase
MKDFWDNRYSVDDYIFGTEPNEFFKSEIDKLPCGKLLLIGEGEGRNAVYAAKLGWQVDAIDFSSTAKSKAFMLAEKNNVTINYSVMDFNDLKLTADNYNAVGIIYIHLEEELRKKVIEKVTKALNNDGSLILELFEKEQITRNSGGPKDLDLLYSLEDAVNDFINLDFHYLNKETITLNEGKGHQGEAVVIRFVGTKSPD